MNHSHSILLLTQKDLIQAGCFDFSKAINICYDAVKSYAEGKVIFPEKVAVIFDEKSQNRINCLPAGFKDLSIYGMKWVSVFPVNPLLNHRPNLNAVLLLSELKTGLPIAFMEGTMCSNIRTAAMSALGAKYLAPENPQRIGFIGAGEQAKSHFLAMKTLFPSITECRVSANLDESILSFIDQMSKFCPDVTFINCGEDYEHAAVDAQIIVTAISGQSPILKAKWVNPGTFYCHVGGYEDEFDVALKANKIVCDNWEIVKHRTQTISRMYQKGLLTDSNIHADIHEIISGKKPGRTSADEITYYNGVGLSFVDVALANWAYELAVSKNIGTTLELQDDSMFDAVLKSRNQCQP